MAYTIIGTVYKIGATETIPTKSGSVFTRRRLTLIQRRFDSNTGEEYAPNYPTLDFSGNKCAELSKYNVGDKVSVSFDIAGNKIDDPQTREEKFFSSLRAFAIKTYVAYQQPPQQPMPQPQMQPLQQPAYQPQYQPQPPQYVQAPQASKELPF